MPPSLLAQSIQGPLVRAWLEGSLVWTVAGDVAYSVPITIVPHDGHSGADVERVVKHLQKAGYTNLTVKYENCYRAKEDRRRE